MALTNFKKIENRKGYLVEDDDRKVFEKGTQKTNFGLGIDDHIEFILYDSSDNQLPQRESQKLVRYIPISDESSRKYFLKPETKENRKRNGADEFIVDVEQLIKEAGYSNGIFKTSTTLVNRRVGKESSSQNFKNQLWIQEISPSRTEIRVLPLNPDGNVNEDLQKRYNILTKESQFRDDAIYYVNEFIENVKVENILKNFTSQKGKITTGQNYINLIKREFGINNFDDFVRRIEEEWKKSLKYYFDNREWRINKENYSKKISVPQEVELSKKILEEVSKTSLILIIEKYLPKREFTNRSILTQDEIETFDRTKKILKTITDKKEITSAEIKYKAAQVRGCTNPNALNFNPDATVDDGSCRFLEDNVREQD